MNIRTVDIKDKEAGKDIVTSFKETGFAVITNHGINMGILEANYKAWAKFFAMQEQFKVLYLFNKEKHDGYFPMKSENAKGFDKKDLKEFFHVYPSTSDLPEPTIETTPGLFLVMETLGVRILHLIQSNAREHFKFDLAQSAAGSQQNLLRILHYPPIEGDTDGAVRAAAHEDINLITLLPAATYPGLQVKDLKGNWIFVDKEIPKDSIIINAGDMLQEASGGYFKSTSHQVVNPEGEGSKVSRYSMPMFIHPHSDTKLSDRYTAKEYLDERLKELGLK